MAFPFGSRMAGVPQLSIATATGDMALEQAVETVRQQAQAIRPSATLQAYNRKQLEFVKWAEETLPGQVNA